MTITTIVFWTNNSFPTKLSLTVGHQKPECQGHRASNKIWQFLWHPLNSWPFCYQTLFNGVYDHKPECLVERFLCCVQVKATVRVNFCCWTFVWTVSFELFNLFLPNLVWWYIIMDHSVLWKDCLATVNVKVTAKAHTINIWSFLLCCQGCWSFCNQT